MGVLDLSIRYKLPLWGGFLIIVSAVSVGASLMLRAYADVRQDVAASADILGRTLARTLAPLLLHQDVWRAYEAIAGPSRGAQENAVQAHTILVIDPKLRIVVSSRPRQTRMLTELKRVSLEHEALAQVIESMGEETAAYDPRSEDNLYYAVPITHEEARLGTLVLAYSKRLLLVRFFDSVRYAALVGMIVVSGLLALTWYWGNRMAVPLVTLADGIRGLGHRLPEAPDPGLYPYHDELGELFAAFSRVVGELRGKAALEKEMVHSERLAAIGRLASGIAHEVNNPLAGMLTALDTLAAHGNADERTRRTVALLERGLQQIRDTVAALLVEARVKSRDLTPQDINDVRTLMAPQARRKSLELRWRNGIPASVPLPASLVRQILINLALNAVHAAETGGRCGCALDFEDDALRLVTFNDGLALSPQQLEHLYEPFGGYTESGHGLGLWVTYQIVRQLGGSIRHRVAEGLTWFEVELPVARAA